jgi:hypothetical protein
MDAYVKQILGGQFEAALAMLHQCIDACPPQHWEGKIARGAFRQVTYHTLFFVDYYLSPSEGAFQLRELHERGGDEREWEPCPGLSRDETLDYVAICRQKASETLAAETADSLQGPSGFVRRRFSRGELHIYNIRHVQHHAGQLSAYLRRVDETLQDHKALPWIGSGWRT